MFIRAGSVSHHLRVGVGLGLRSVHVDVHLVTLGSTLLGALLLELLLLILTLALEVDAAVLGHLILLDDLLALTSDADHSVVTAVGSTSVVAVGGLVDLILELLGTILLLLDIDVSLGLLGGKLGRSSGIIIPVKMLLVAELGRRRGQVEREIKHENIPLDGKAGDAGLVGQHVATDLLNDGLGRGVGGQLLGLVLVVDVVAHAHELATIVGAGQQDDGDTHNLGVGNALDVGGVGLEDELVDADGDGADEQSVELLVILVGGSRADVGQLPLEVCSIKR